MKDKSSILSQRSDDDERNRRSTRQTIRRAIVRYVILHGLLPEMELNVAVLNICAYSLTRRLASFIHTFKLSSRYCAVYNRVQERYNTFIFTFISCSSQLTRFDLPNTTYLSHVNNAGMATYLDGRRDRGRT
jgi:hypothetical protein